jgi:hypothetical protein
MLVSYNRFGGGAPNNVQLGDFTEDKFMPLKLRIMCTINAVRNSVMRRNKWV